MPSLVNIFIAAFASLLAQNQPTPAKSAEPATPAPGKPMQMQLQVVPNGVDPKTDELLSRLEVADQGIRSLEAKILYIKKLPEFQGGDTTVHDGLLSFGRFPLGGGAERRKFAVEFNRITINKKVREDTKFYRFDGEWAIELLPRTKEFRRWRVVAPGSKTDPLRIGQGPFPLPIGQRKADIIERFETSIAPWNDKAPAGQKMQGLLPGTTQLKLVPRPETKQAREFREIRIWYRNTDLLPIFAMTVNTDDSTSEVLLEDLAPNLVIDESKFSTRSPDAKEGWVGKEDADVKVEGDQVPVGK
jgi:hypothetical protein